MISDSAVRAMRGDKDNPLRPRRGGGLGFVVVNVLVRGQGASGEDQGCDPGIHGQPKPAVRGDRSDQGRR